jgi:putative membrane protein
MSLPRLRESSKKIGHGSRFGRASLRQGAGCSSPRAKRYCGEAVRECDLPSIGVDAANVAERPVGGLQHIGVAVMKFVPPRGTALLLLLVFPLVGAGLGGCNSRHTEPAPPPTEKSTASQSSAPSMNAGLSSDSKSNKSAVTPPAPSGSMGGLAVSANDVEFVSTAASAGTLAVEASRVALEKTRTSSVRSFAQRMVEDQSRLGTELRALNVASSVGNVAVVNPKDGEELRKLRDLQGREFDKEYIAQIGIAGRKNVDAFQKVADSASDTQLKSFAQSKLPELREHLRTAQALGKSVGATAANSNSGPLAQRSTK